jgi:hypothetical protein
MIRGITEEERTRLDALTQRFVENNKDLSCFTKEEIKFIHDCGDKIVEAVRKEERA